jgi:molybdate transport system substrate-binding protein
MTKRSIAGALAVAAVALLLSPRQMAAQAKPIRLLVSNGMKAAMEELQPQCERAIGSPLEFQFSSTAALKKRIEAGETFDGTIITSEAIADLIKQGKLAGASRVELGRSALGIGIRMGSSKPDIRTTDALKQALLKAPSITYPQDGATRGFIEKMFERMGIAAQMKPKIILAPGSGPATESVAAGKATFVITLFSEIVPVHGVEILGALPGEYQNYVNFAAAANASSKNAGAIKSLTAFLAGPKAAPILKAKGLEVR